MTARRIYVAVEGPTEEKFIKDVLGPEFVRGGVYLTPILIGLARERDHRGGKVNEQRAVGHVVRLLKQDREAACTTCLDYYGIDDDFPGKRESRSLHSAIDRAAVIEGAFREKVLAEMGGSFLASRFLPYIQMHEYEGLLFSDPQALGEAMGRQDLRGPLAAIAAGFETPEDIDDSYETKPSKRIGDLHPEYQKTVDGIIAAGRIGIPTMRCHCPHFDSWYEALRRI